MNQEKTGKLIAILRKEKGLTQAQLAERIGVSDRAVSKWERGICLPRPSKLGMIADVLETSVSELLRGERTLNKNQQDKKKIHKITFILKCFLSIVVVFLFVYAIFYNSEIKKYIIVSSNDDYSGNGNVIIENESITLDLFNLILKNNAEKIKGYYFEYSLYLDEFLIIKNGDVFSYKYDHKDKLLELDQFLSSLSVHIVDDIYDINDTDILDSTVQLVINYLDDELSIQKYVLTFEINK